MQGLGQTVLALYFICLCFQFGFFCSVLFFSIMPMYVVCTCVGRGVIRTRVQVHMCACRSQRLTLGIFLHCSPEGSLFTRSGPLAEPRAHGFHQPSQPCCLRSPVSTTGVLGLQEACCTHLHLFLSVLIYSLRISRMYTMCYDPIHPCFYMLYPLSHLPGPVLSL